jgi:hypothetical protein
MLEWDAERLDAVYEALLWCVAHPYTRAREYHISPQEQAANTQLEGALQDIDRYREAQR